MFSIFVYVHGRRQSQSLILLLKQFMKGHGLLLVYNQVLAFTNKLGLLLRAKRNEKEMKVKPATSFKLLTIFIHKKIR